MQIGGFIMWSSEEICLGNTYLTDVIGTLSVILLRAVCSCNIHLLLQGTLNIITCGPDDHRYSDSCKKCKLSTVLFY